MKKTLTVFTPTYNRAYCLHLGYEALKRQTSKDFKWLIIDDGSTDNTKELVDSWIAEGQVEIEYFYKENGGMHTAHNKAYELIDTELNVCIDSDDYMPDDAVEKIISLWEIYGSNKYAGLIGLDADTKGNVIGTKFPEFLKHCKHLDLRAKYGVIGDKKWIMRTDIVKRYAHYPTYKNEKFVPLYLPYVIDNDYDSLCFNKIFCIVDYKIDGSTLNIYKQYYNNPNGFSQQRKILMKYSPYRREKFRNAIHYVATSIISKNRNFLSETTNKFYTIMAIPFGIAFCIIIILKNKL